MNKTTNNFSYVARQKQSDPRLESFNSGSAIYKEASTDRYQKDIHVPKIHHMDHFAPILNKNINQKLPRLVTENLHMEVRSLESANKHEK